MDKAYIYIVQMYSQTIPSRIVKLMTKYKYSHVGISLHKECDTIYSFGRRSLYNIFNGGFIVEHKTSKFFKRFSKTICRIYELEITEEQYLQVKDYLTYMEANKEMYKYDFLGVFLRTFNIPVSFKNYYVCSQFVAEVLEKFDIYKFKKDTFYVVPRDFEMIDGIKEIYSGFYIEE